MHTHGKTARRPSPASTRFRRLLSSLIPSASRNLQNPSPFAISFRARCIRMRWMHRTPRVMHDVHTPAVSSPLSLRRAVGGVPRGSFAFSDAPPSSSKASICLFRSFPLLPSSHLYFSSYYISLSFILALASSSVASLCGFLHSFSLSLVQLKAFTVEYKPFAHRFPPSTCSRVRYASMAD